MGEASVLASLVKVALTFGLLFLTLRLVGRYAGPGRGPLRNGTRPVDVVGQTALARGASVVVVRVGTRCFAVGVTDNNVNMLSEVDIDLAQPAPPAGTPVSESRPSWKELIESMRERTVRR